MTPQPQDPSPSAFDLRRRLDDLERENARLRTRLEPILGPDNPAFDLRAFGKAMRFYTLLYLGPVTLLTYLAGFLATYFHKYIPRIELFPGFPLIDPGGI
jgi:hypothetical protein